MILIPEKERLIIEQVLMNEVPLPPDWDGDIYNEKIPFTKRIAYAKERAKRLGSGSARVAFVIPYEGRETVLKIAKNKKGMAQNELEASILGDRFVGEITIPMIDYDESSSSPTWIHTEKAEKASEEKLCQIMKIPNLWWLVKASNTQTGNGSRYQRFGSVAAAHAAYFEELPNATEEDYEHALKYVQEIGELVSNFGILSDDFSHADNWGIWKGKPVVIDVGFDEAIRDQYYSR